jgi:16S rRNA (guanine527-N7)-methyltransferase
VLASAQEDIEGRLRAGIASLGLEPAGDAVDTLARYVSLLARWNETFNLIGPCSPEEMVARHLLDSLTALPYLAGTAVLDLGTGAGLPGIPLAVLDSHRRYTLLDSKGKKTRFVTQAIGELGLDNVTVVQARVEAFVPEQPFDTVITRAFSSLEHFVRSCQHLTAAGGRLVAMKGLYPDEELKPLLQTVTSIEVSSVDVPGLDAERHVVIIEA